MRISFFPTIVLLFLIITSPCYGLDGQVVGVSDGDTITVLYDNKSAKIRLYGIDCPEKKQAFGQRAKQFTADQVFKKIVEIKPVTMDRYGRTVGLVYYNGDHSLNKNLINSGLAWVYTRYCTKPQCQDWIEIEKRAREAKRGLWADPDPVPPWQFRRSKKAR